MVKTAKQIRIKQIANLPVAKIIKWMIYAIYYAGLLISHHYISSFWIEALVFIGLMLVVFIAYVFVLIALDEYT